MRQRLMVNLILVALVLSGHLSLADQPQTEGRQGPTKENPKENFPPDHPTSPAASMQVITIPFPEGETFSGKVATESICQGQTVELPRVISIDWGDGTAGVGNAAGEGQVLANHKYTKAGNFAVTVKESATCKRNGTKWSDTAQGLGLFVIYTPSKIDQLSFMPPSLKGGESGVAVVGLATSAPQWGELIFLSSNNPTVLVPNQVVVPADSRFESFRISSERVKEPLDVIITARSGSVTKTASLRVTP